LLQLTNPDYFERQ